MSRKLLFPFVDSAVSTARTQAAVGRPAEALVRLEAALGSLTGTDAADAHKFAAELYRDMERFAKARRHLRAAIAIRPRDAALHYELGLAFQNDPYGCDRRAAARFRAAVAFAPENPTYRAAYGLALVRLNRVRAGLRELKTAVDAAPTDTAVLGVVLVALREADRPRLAVKWLEKSLFLAPLDGELRRLWDRARFDAARAGQEADYRVGRRPVGVATVPFVRVATDTTPSHGIGGIVRRDVGSRPAPHLGRLKAYRTEQG